MDINTIKTKNYYHNYVTIKQADNNSPIELLMCGPDGKIMSTLNTECTVTLLDTIDNQVRQKTTESIVNGTLSFKVVNDLKANRHTLEVTTLSGTKFPSDGNFDVYVAQTHDESQLNIIQSIPTELALQTVTQQVIGYFDNVHEDLNTKIDRGDVTVADINKNKGLLDQTYFTEETKKIWTGNAPVNATPADGSLTTPKYADNSVTETKADFISVSSNLVNFSNFKEGFTLNDTNTETVNSSWGYTDYIPVEPSTLYSTASVGRWLLYDASKQFISGQTNTTTSFTTHANARYARFNVRLTDKEIAQINKGSLVAYQKPGSYLKTAVANLMPDAVKTTNIKDKNVTKDKVDFIESTRNLIDESALMRGYLAGEVSKGVPSPNASNSVLVHIPVKPSTTYTISTGAVHRVFLFDASKQFLTEKYMASTPASFTTTSSTAYVTVNVSDAYLGKAQMNEGATLAEYSVFKKDTLKGVYGEGTQDVIFKSDNLLDESKIAQGKALSDTGDYVESPSNGVTEFIAVDPSTIYEADVAQSTRVAFYDANKTFISYLSNTGDAPFKFTTPATAKYIRTNVHISYLTRAYITKGSLGRKIYPFGHNFKPNAIPKRARSFVEYYNAPTLPSMTVNDSTYLKNIGVQDYYALYDALVSEYPELWTKTTLGNDADGVPINKYEFKSPEVPNIKNRYTRVMITTGHHGSEKVPMYTVYKFMEQVCKQWHTSPILEQFRFNYHFVIIPVVCPYGVTNHTRKNKNGVDIMRNYPRVWEGGSSDPAASTYRGPSPMSEIETVYVNRTYKSYNTWDYVLDYHNFSTDADINRNFWVAGTSQLTRDAGQIFMRRIAAEMSKKHSFVNVNKYLGWIDMTNVGIYYEASLDGFQASLFECRETIALGGGQMYDSMAMTWALEGFTNMLYIMTKNAVG